MSLATWGWHVPAAYELALRSPAWHVVEHASFLAAGLLFWWPVVQPWPSRPRWPRWAMIPYLLVADLQNTALAAMLVFSDRVLYPSYARGRQPARRSGGRRRAHVGADVARVSDTGSRVDDAAPRAAHRPIFRPFPAVAREIQPAR